MLNELDFSKKLTDLFKDETLSKKDIAILVKVLTLVGEHLAVDDEKREGFNLWDRLVDPTLPKENDDVEGVSLEGFEPYQLNKMLESVLLNLRGIRAILKTLCDNWCMQDMERAGFIIRIDALLKEANKIDGCLNRKIRKVG